MSHLQLSFQGRGGDQHGHSGVCVSDLGSGVFDGWRFCFWRRAFGRWLLISFSYVCNTAHF